jgi:hypothetical protein
MRPIWSSALAVAWTLWLISVWNDFLSVAV